MKTKKRLVVAVAQDDDVLKSIQLAQDIITPILVGDKAEITKLIEIHNIELNNPTIIDIKDKIEACKHSIKLIKEKKADILMKGLVDTKILLKEILNRETGIREGELLSHVAQIKVSTYHKPILLTDAAININPDAITKINILNNALKVAYRLNITQPKVAVISAVEKVNDKMQSTLDAQKLVNHYKNNDRVIVEGPMAFDIAISKEAAQTKEYISDVSGDLDIFLAPNIETANVFYKSMLHLANAQIGAVVVGAKVPIVMTSRSDSDLTKLNSIKLALKLSER